MMVREGYEHLGYYLFNNGFEDGGDLDMVCPPSRSLDPLYEQLREKFGDPIPEAVLNVYPGRERELLQAYAEGAVDKRGVNADDFAPEEKSRIRSLLVRQNALLEHMKERTGRLLRGEITPRSTLEKEAEGA